MGMIDSGYTSNAPLAYVGQTIWHDYRSYIPAGFVASDGLLLSRDNPLFKLVQAGRVPVCTELEWWADPKKRGCYTMGTDGTNFRIPDRNGVQSGSFIAPVLRGDAGNTSQAGVMQQNAAPNITGKLRTVTASSLFESTSGVTGSFSGSEFQPYAQLASAPGAPANYPRSVTFDASNSSSAYGRDGTSEVRMNSIVGCYIICFAGKVQNEELLDALTLATRIEQVNTQITNDAIKYDTWYSYDDPKVLEFITWGDTGSEISFDKPTGFAVNVKFGRNSIQLKGCLRKASGTWSANATLYTIKKIPNGLSTVNKVLQSAVRSYLEGSNPLNMTSTYTSAIYNGTVGAKSIATIAGGTCTWVMIDEVLTIS